MSLRSLMLVASILVGSAGTATADTLHLKDGTVVDGIIEEERVNSVIVRVGPQRIPFRRSNIVKIEKNEKASKETLGEQRIQARDERMLEETGLTREQRDTMAELLRGLASRSDIVKKNAQEKLVELARETGGFEFLAGLVPHIRFVGADILEVLSGVDRAKMRTLLEETTSIQYGKIRAKAIELVGRMGFSDLTEYVARGLVDSQITVRAAAAESIGALNVRRATPLLIAGMRSYEPRYANTCREALSRIWSDKTLTIDFKTADEWQAYWEAHGNTVPNAWTPETLAPLYKPSPNAPDPLFH